MAQKIGKIIKRVKNFLKLFLPASSKTVNSRFNKIERQIKGVHEPNLFYLMCRANEVQAIHYATFLPYRNIHRGREIVVVGSGPTLNDYVPIEGAIHIGVNGTYHNRNIALDYYFVQDFESTKEGGAVSLDELKELNCEKFIGHYVKKQPRALEGIYFPEYPADYIGAKSYFVHDYYPGWITYQIPVNIEFYPIVDNGSTIFAALQFALYTHPKRIYIVGCDSSYLLGQHFDGIEGRPMAMNKVYKTWQIMKKHIDTFYPDIEIISINPVGLKGIFNDMYTREYEFLKDDQDKENE